MMYENSGPFWYHVDFLYSFSKVLKNCSVDFLKVFSLNIGCFFTHRQYGPWTSPFSQECVCAGVLFFFFFVCLVTKAHLWVPFLLSHWTKWPKITKFDGHKLGFLHQQGDSDRAIRWKPDMCMVCSVRLENLKKRNTCGTKEVLAHFQKLSVF